MKSLIIFLFIALISPHIFAQQTVDVQQEQQYQQPAIPTHFDSQIAEYLFYDNNFNVIQRLRSEEKIKANLMSEADKAPVRIHIFVVDYSAISKNVAMSQFIENSDWAKVKSSDEKIYIPCLESDTAAMQVLKLKFGEPVYTTMGHKVLSRATYYVDPVGPTGGFFAKFIPHLPGLEQKLEREILVNDYIKSQLSELPPEMRNLTMDSFMAVNLSFFGIPFSVAYRSADRIQNKPENIRTYPGHGLLGCDSCVREYAVKLFGNNVDADKAVDRWKTQELLPNLAKYMAYANHVLGASFESHTQNMVFDIDTNSGKITNIYFRDFADVLLNPIPVLVDGRLSTEINWNRVKLLSVHGNYFSDQGAAMAQDIWYHASIYSGQGVTSHITGFQKQQRHIHLFLEAYITETERIIGHPIVLSDDAKRVMQQLEQKVSKADFYSGELNERSPLRNAMASILKSVFEQAYQAKIEKIENDLKLTETARDQEKLRKDFYRLMLAQRVVFVDSATKKLLVGEDTKLTWLKSTINAYFKLGLGAKNKTVGVEFKVYQNRLWMIDSETQKFLAATIESYSSSSSGSFLSRFKKLIGPQHAILKCSALFN